MSQYKADTDVLKKEQAKLLKEFYSSDNKQQFEIRRRLREIQLELFFISKEERKSEVRSF